MRSTLKHTRTPDFSPLMETGIGLQTGTNHKLQGMRLLKADTVRRDSGGKLEWFFFDGSACVLRRAVHVTLRDQPR